MRIFPVFLPHAGCSHQCIFCDQHQTTGQESVPPPAAVGEMLDKILPKTGEGEVAFYGGSFTLLSVAEQSAYLVMARSFIDAGRITGIRISTRPDALPAETADRLAANGVTTVELGCQSFSSTVLAASRRGHDGTVAEAAVDNLRRQGLQVGLQLMPGLPGADRDEAWQSLVQALGLRPDFLRIYPVVVLPHTELAALWQKGRYRAWELDEAVECCADLLFLCRRASVPVIRLGLQGAAAFDRGEGWLAGPYHPAFGQLVRSRLWRRALAASRQGGKPATITVSPAELGDAIGHRRGNLNYFSDCGRPLTVVGDPHLARGTLRFGGRILALQDLAGYANEV